MIHLKTFNILLTPLLAVWLAACTLTEPPDLTARNLVEQAAQTLERFRAHKELKGYADFLPGAAAVVILPQVLKASFIGGGEAGNGVLVARKPDGSWSDPAFHTLGAASIGLQIGVQDTALVLIIRSPGALDSILRHQGKLGADIGASVGVAGIGLEASTTSNLGVDVLAFANTNMGAYMGGSLEGSVLAIRRDLNEAYYGVGAKPHEILSGQRKAPGAKRLIEMLGR